MILLALTVKRKFRIEANRKDLARDGKTFFDGGTHILQQPVVHIPDRQQLQQLHGVPLSGDGVGFFISIERRASPAIFLQLVIERDPVDIEYVRGVALIAAAFLHYP